MMDIFPAISREVDEFDVLVTGHLKWNPYFGETAKKAPRGDPSTCTSAMIRGRDADGRPYVLIIDPTLRQSPADYYFDINRRTGLRPSDVTHCYVTHSHFDHQAGLNYFPDAVWCAAEPVAEELKHSPHIDGGRVTAVAGEFLPGVAVIALPGHREHLFGAAFMLGGSRYVAAGDAVMTKHHLEHETTMFAWDEEIGAETVRRLKASADFILPGHDDLIFNRRGGGQQDDGGVWESPEKGGRQDGYLSDRG